MKLLFDENLSPRLVRRVASRFPGSQHVDGAGLEGRADQAIWDHAKLHGFTIVSKDNDFRQISFLKGQPPKVVWLSVGNAGTQEIGELLRRNEARIVSFLENPEESLLVFELNPGGRA